MMGWAGHVVYMTEVRYSYAVLDGKFEGERNI
jgi:hypothetical protein